MTRNGIIKCLMAIILLAYLVVALSFTSKMAAEDTFNGVDINIIDDDNRGFVTSNDIDAELNMLSSRINSIRHDSLNTLDLERHIMNKDNIEKVNCVVLNSGKLRIDVTPLRPLARVFDRRGDNYYINRAGKHMQASVRYSTDVPVIYGSFDDKIKPTAAFPLLDYLSRHPDLAAMTSAIEVGNNSDLILVPTIRGHVVVIGDTLDLDNKFKRLNVFYHKVMPVKGWEYYDTISLKWRGQVVAKQRNKKAPKSSVVVEEHSDLDDISTMDTAENPQAANQSGEPT